MLNDQVSFTEIRKNTGIERQPSKKRRKDLGFKKYHLNVINKDLFLILEGSRSVVPVGNRVPCLYHPSGQTHFFYSFLAKNVARLKRIVKVNEFPRLAFLIEG